MAEWPPLIPAPSNPSDWPKWRQELQEIRRQGLSPEISQSYDNATFAWVRSCLICAKVMLFDREFYDPASNRFTVEPYIERMRKDYGSLDALVLWQAYPRIGFDSRNQYDHYRLAPDLKGVVERLHKLHVRVILAYNPWDTGTHREGVPDSEALARIVQEFGFDGVFLDTLPEGDHALRTALDKTKLGVVMESELALPVSAMAANHASWAQWFDDSQAPGIMRNRWIERRHMMHVIRRWDMDHTSELHMAWMNGSGVLVWENIFGSFNRWCDRDAAILRSMTPIRRRYADLFERGDWEPLVPTTLEGVYATRWTLGPASLWTIVNRNDQPAAGQVLNLATDGTTRLYDLVRGKELDHALVEIEPRGIGALLSLPSSMADAGLQTFLRNQSAGYTSGIDPSKRTRLLTVRTSPPRSSNPSRADAMLEISAAQPSATCRMRARECGEYGPAPFEAASWIPIHFTKYFEIPLRSARFAIGRRGVTNREFLEFIQSGYKPAHRDSFLTHWRDGAPTAEQMDEPVCFVDLDDARAYAKWAGLRLPTEVEWQLASEHADFERGELWNWTESEHFDGHTRFSILKGGCRWKAVGSDWYADSGPQPPDWSAKYIHFFPALDRCETIGFRCAMDW